MVNTPPDITRHASDRTPLDMHQTPPDTTRHASNTIRHHQTPTDITRHDPDTTRHASDTTRHHQTCGSHHKTPPDITGHASDTTRHHQTCIRHHQTWPRHHQTLPDMLQIPPSLNLWLFKNIAHVGSFHYFVFVFVFVLVDKGYESLYWWTKDMSQRALHPIYINTGTLEFLASLSLYLSFCVYLSLSLSSLGVCG